MRARNFEAPVTEYKAQLERYLRQISFSRPPIIFRKRKRVDFERSLHGHVNDMKYVDYLFERAYWNVPATTSVSQGLTFWRRAGEREWQRFDHASERRPVTRKLYRCDPSLVRNGVSGGRKGAREKEYECSLTHGRRRLWARGDNSRGETSRWLSAARGTI